MRQAELATVTQERQQLQDVNRSLQEANHTLQGINQTLQEEFSTCVETKKLLQAQLQQELEHAYAAIAAMQTSKSWKLRTQWIRFKQLFHLKE